MSDDYLWDKSGKPDPEVEKLERLLGELGHRSAKPASSAAPEVGGHASSRLTSSRAAPEGTLAKRRLAVPAWAAAAAVLLVATGMWWWKENRAPVDWQVERVQGAPRVGTVAIAVSGRFARGDWLETDAASRARVKVGKIGELLVEPNTRLRLVDSGPREDRLHLELGTLTATILAPPRHFVVETPSAHAIDLGCVYKLEVDTLGGGLVTVLSGWVSFERAGRESFIPAGAQCATRPGFGPGTPYFNDASSGFKSALAAFDIASHDAAARQTALDAVLAEARRGDALTLWHLLARSAGTERDMVYARLETLVPPPTGVTREGVLQGDRKMLDRWWNELGFGEMEWWRLWQGSWPQTDGSS